MSLLQVIDKDLQAYLERLKSNGALNNTMLLVMGDHGNRFDAIRNTVIGRIEERMPYLAVMLPKALEHFKDNLKTNAEILTSWMDVYEMVMDVAMMNIEQKSKQVNCLIWHFSILKL
jgi:membrane-anchored protein YejM (alkaline phosphatase superfamily)